MQWKFKEKIDQERIESLLVNVLIIDKIQKHKKKWLCPETTFKLLMEAIDRKDKPRVRDF